jgi:hypothetical protein
VAQADEASELGELLEARRGREVAALGEVAFASTADGWKSSGVRVDRGQAVSLFTFGEGQAAPQGASSPSSLVWVRIGASDIVPLGGDAWSFVAWDEGELELGTRPPAVNWLDCKGRLAGEAASAARHELAVTTRVVAWAGDLESGLGAVGDHALLTATRDGYRAEPTLPAGFRPVCYLPYSRVFHAFDENGRHGIHGLAPATAGIVKKAVDLPLGDDSEISFEWRYDTLPAKGPETDPRHHDYSSIAVEFDNGQDITWMWGTHVEAGTSFHCPLPWWDQRETHIVLESGPEGLGEWRRYTRPIAADYDSAVGGERPKRIVGVWFISVGVFGGDTADARWANVVLKSKGEEIVVFDQGGR